MYNLYVLATHEHQTERPVTSERHRGIKSRRRKCQQPPSHPQPPPCLSMAQKGLHIRKHVQQPPSHPQPPPLFVHGAERSAHQEARPTASQSPSAPTLACPWRRKVCTSGSTSNSLPVTLSPHPCLSMTQKGLHIRKHAQQPAAGVQELNLTFPTSSSQSSVTGVRN